jgi:DtxR family Mn-dependent transcriptional regulator
VSTKVSASVERYLENIYLLQEKNGFARTSDVALMYGVVSGTITNTISKLKKNGLVEHQPYRGTTLTEEGNRIALKAVRKHNLLTLMFTNLLGVQSNLAYRVASNIAYYIPDEVITKVEKKLKTKR